MFTRTAAKSAAFGLAALATVSVSIPAHAEESPDSATPTPTVMFPVYHGDTTVVQLETRADKRWSVRKIARGIDAQLPNVTINVTGKCATSVHDLCIKTFVDYYDVAEMEALIRVPGYVWSGLMVPGETRDSNYREVYLNLAQKGKLARKLVVAHELGHALGLAHHLESGVLGPNMYGTETPTLSPNEAAALNAWYAVPQVKSEPAPEVTPVPDPEVTSLPTVVPEPEVTTEPNPITQPISEVVTDPITEGLN